MTLADPRSAAIAAGGTVETFNDVNRPATERRVRSDEIYSDFVLDGEREITPPNDLVQDLLPKSGIAFIGGQSQAGKTFIIVELACRLATGSPFFGRQVRERVGIAIMAGEGFESITNRLAAAKQVQCLNHPLPIAYLGNVPNLKNEKEVSALIESLRKLDRRFREDFGTRLGAVFYDTLVTTFDLQDENDNSEASKVTRCLRLIGKETGTLSIPVHHYGGAVHSGLRGASAWRGNCDSILSVLADTDQVTGETKKRELALSKNRDGVAGPIAPFDLVSVQLGFDEEGKPFGTCAVSPQLGENSSFGKPQRTARESRSLVVFREAFTDCLDSGHPFPIDNGPTVKAVKIAALQGEYQRRYCAGEANPEKQKDAARKAFARSLEKLGREYVTRVRDGEAWIWAAQ